MQDTNGYSSGTLKRKERRYFERRYSDRFTDDDIEQAWRKAYEKVGKFVMPAERS